jgi:hypothetical protein
MISARGTGAQAQVELITQAGSLASLVEAAGEDETLDGADDDRLNVTHVSTARYLLAIDNNAGAVPADAEALRNAEAGIEPAELLDTAGIIKLIVDEGAIAVPEGETTLSLLRSDSADVSNQDAIDTLLAGAGLVDDAGALTPEFRAALDAAIENTLADGAVLGRFTPAMLTGSTIWTVAMHPGWVPGRGTVVDFADDGSGVSWEKAVNAVSGFGGFSLDDAAAAFSWTIEDGTLQISYPDYRTPLEFSFGQELVTTYGFDQSVADFIDAEAAAGHLSPALQYPLMRRVVSGTVSLISSVPGHGSEPGLAQVRSTIELEYDIDDLLETLPAWHGELPRGHGTQKSDQVMYMPPLPNALADAPPAAGDAWAVPVIYTPVDAQLSIAPTPNLYPDLLTLEDGGMTSTGTAGAGSYAWSVAADGLVLESGDERYVYTPIETDGYVYFGLVSHYTDDRLDLRYAQWMARADGTGSELAGDLVQDLPLYWQAGLSAGAQSQFRDDGLLDLIWVFGYTFHADGTNERVVADTTGTCLEVDTASCFRRDGSLWSTTIDDDTIVRDRQTSYNETRTWKVLSYAPGGRAVVLEWQRSDFFLDGSWELTIPPRLNMLELTDLRDWPEEYAHSTL